MDVLAESSRFDRRPVYVSYATMVWSSGAATFGLDFLFVTGSLHAEELDAFNGAAEEHVKQVVAPSNARLVGYMPRLVW